MAKSSFLASKIYGTIFVITLCFCANYSAEARNSSVWHTDTTNRTGIMARTTVPLLGMNSLSFLVIFEYERNCDPIFAMIRHRGPSIGNFIRRDSIAPSVFFIEIDNKSFTWHGMISEYSSATELAVGITRDALSALLSSPRNINFVENNSRFPAPFTGVSNNIRLAASICAERIRR